MHLAVLMTNTDESAFAQRHPKDGEKYARLIASVRPDWRVTSFDVKDGVFPNDITAFDGVLITGSPASVNADLPWVPDLLQSIRTAYAAQIPQFGACFGHQAIAVALGGRVEENPEGWSFGRCDMQVIARPDWFTGPDQFSQYTAHIEHVSELPDGAEVIFNTRTSAVGGFRCGSTVYTTQNHPEMTPEFIDALVHELNNALPAEVIQAAQSSLNQQADQQMFAQSIAQFFEQAVQARLTD